MKEFTAYEDCPREILVAEGLDPGPARTENEHSIAEEFAATLEENQDRCWFICVKGDNVASKEYAVHGRKVVFLKYSDHEEEYDILTSSFHRHGEAFDPENVGQIHYIFCG